MPNDFRKELLDVLEAVSEAQLRTIRKLRQPQAPKPMAAARARMSHVEMVYDILQTARRPLHISEILQQISQQFGLQLDRESVVSALVKRVARKDRFRRTAPNTFALLEGKAGGA
jgi:hypothetical protein